MALPDIPIWTFKPNWREGITERLEWLTDVLDSDNGTEQRRAIRLSPRRYFEMVFNPVDEARSYFGLFLHRLADDEFMLPLFHDKGMTSAAVYPFETEIPLDNTYREFETGGYAVLLTDAFTYEVVEIMDQDDTSLTVSAIVNTWPEKTAIYPLRIARLSEESSTKALTSRVGQASLEFELNQANDYPEGAWADLYNGVPIILTPPNWRENLDLRFLRSAETLDNDSGLSYLAAFTERSFTVQMHSWLIRGRAEHAAFRSMLYRLRGRQVAAWLPTFTKDMALARATATGHNALNIKQIGYGYTGGAVSGRKHVMFKNDAGSAVCKEITGTASPIATGEERLTISGTVGAVLPVGRTGSFLEIGRLDQDRIEIFHATDTSGTSECKAAFRSFLNERVEDAVVDYPAQTGVKTNSACGQPL